MYLYLEALAMYAGGVQYFAEVLCRYANLMPSAPQSNIFEARCQGSFEPPPSGTQNDIRFAPPVSTGRVSGSIQEFFFDEGEWRTRGSWNKEMAQRIWARGWRTRIFGG